MERKRRKEGMKKGNGMECKEGNGVEGRKWKGVNNEGRKQARKKKKYCLPFTGLRVNLRCSKAVRQRKKRQAETGS